MVLLSKLLTRSPAPLTSALVRSLSQKLGDHDQHVYSKDRLDSESSPRDDSQRAKRKHHWEQRRTSSLAGDDNARERLQQVSSYYNQSAIDEVSAYISRRVQLASWYNNSLDRSENYILMNAKYLHTELPVRISHRIKDFRNLPFIVGCNPSILAVHELYIRAFRLLWEFPKISSASENERYCGLLRRLLDDHKDVITWLAEGFRESKKHLSPDNIDLISAFLNKTLTSRLAIRLLAEHHLEMMEQRPGHVGVFKVEFRPEDLVKKRAEVSKTMCEMRYGRAPPYEVEMEGPSGFVHIPMPFDYILGELLKNSFRAVVEHYWEKQVPMPAIRVLVVNGKDHLSLRVSDRGGGVPPALRERVWDYLFTTADADDNPANHAGGFFGSMSENRAAGPMHGFGFGLPTSRAYAQYLGGDLTLESVPEYGTETYLRVAHIDNVRLRV